MYTAITNETYKLVAKEAEVGDILTKAAYLAAVFSEPILILKDEVRRLLIYPDGMTDTFADRAPGQRILG